jgi:hypothetical protein
MISTPASTKPAITQRGKPWLEAGTAAAGTSLRLCLRPGAFVVVVAPVDGVERVVVVAAVVVWVVRVVAGGGGGGGGGVRAVVAGTVVERIVVIVGTPVVPVGPVGPLAAVANPAAASPVAVATAAKRLRSDLLTLRPFPT